MWEEREKKNKIQKHAPIAQSVLSVSVNELPNKRAEVDFAAGGDPFVEGADAASGDHEDDRLAGCWVEHRLALQVWHLATLALDVGVADVIAS